MMMVVVMGVMMCIMVEQNLCWFHSWIHTQMKTGFSVHDSRPSSSPAYTATDYCPKKIVNDIDLRRSFYSKQLS